MASRRNSPPLASKRKTVPTLGTALQRHAAETAAKVEDQMSKQTGISGADVPETDQEMEAMIDKAGKTSKGKGRNGLQPVIESPKEGKPKKDRSKPCRCGCSTLTQGGDFRPGHDSKLKGELLRAARADKQDARSELLRRGWASDEQIDSPSRNGRLSDEERAERRYQKLRAKSERLRAELAKVEAEIEETLNEGAAEAA